MRAPMRRRLFRRRILDPLILRTTWGDFEFRMRRAIAIDMAILLGEANRADLLRQQETLVLPRPDVETVVEQQWWDYEAETMVDKNQTQPLGVVTAR